MVDDALSMTPQTIPAENPTSAVLEIPWEWLAYALLAALVFLLRTAELDTVSPRAGEIPGFLAAWRDQPMSSPLLFWAERVGFGLLGGTVFAGRILTALVGAAVVFSPVLFRSELGRTRAFLLTVLLATLPPLFIASRTSEGVVWTLAVAALMARLTLTAIQTGDKSRWTAALAALVVLILVTEPGAMILALLLGLSVVGALRWADADEQPEEPVDDDDTEPEIVISQWARLRAQRRGLPWESGLALGALITLSISTLFFTPSGLGNVGQLLAGVVSLFTTSNPDNLIGVVVFQLPWTLVLAGAGVWATNREGWSLVDRLFAVWALCALVATLFIPGLTNAHAVFLAVPLCGLASGTLAMVFINARRRSIWAEAEADAGDDLAALYRPSAGRWILGVVVFALLMLTSVHFQTVSREGLQVLDGSLGGVLSRLQSQSVFVDVRIGLLWGFIGLMFLGIGFFLAAGIWGNRTTLQGYALGLLIFLLITQTSTGWYTAVFNADSPIEAWDSPTTGQGYQRLAETLHDFMLRETLAFPLLPITVVRDPASGVTEDGLLGWLLKDQRVEFVDTLGEARAKPFVIVSDATLEANVVPDLGGSYVGQKFVLAKAWNPDTLLGVDVMPWWMQRQTRSKPYPVQTVTLWVRQDVFESVPVGDLLLAP